MFRETTNFQHGSPSFKSQKSFSFGENINYKYACKFYKLTFRRPVPEIKDSAGFFHPEFIIFYFNLNFDILGYFYQTRNVNPL